MPPEAIRIGNTSDGEHLFMGRTMVEGTLTPGKVQTFKYSGFGKLFSLQVVYPSDGGDLITSSRDLGVNAALLV